MILRMIIPALAVLATTGLGEPRILVHLDQAAGQQPENIAVEPDGSADVTFAFTGQVARVTRSGVVQVIGQVPVPADGDVPNNHSKIFVGGIVRTPDGTRYVAASTGTTAGTGVYRFRPGRAAPERIAALPAGSFLNGMALDGGSLFIADSAQSTIWRVPLRGGTPSAWITDATLAPVDGFGADGLKIRDGAVYVSNIGVGTLVRIPLTPGGAGEPRIIARGLGPIDDFAFAGRTVIAAINQDNRVVTIDDGTATTVLTSADGLSNPTSVAVRDGAVYVTDGAYFTGRDPNLLLAHLRR